MLSDNIQTYRKAKGWSQEELAVRLNVVRQTVSKWERNVSVPDAEMLIQLAELLEVPVSTLLDIKETDLRVDALAEELENLNAELAARNRHMILVQEATRKRNLLLFFCFAAMFVSLAVRQPVLSLLLCGGCVLAAACVLYRNLTLLTRLSTDDLRLGVLRVTTLVNIGFVVIAIVVALLSATGVLVFSERGERIFAMCFITAVMVFVGIVSPRLPFQRHTGLRLPWTVRDEDTWNLAHRILGFVSLPLALLYVAASLTLDDFDTVTIAAILLWIGIPGVLSYIFYWKKYHGKL